jgi:molecular chaperone GrpE
LPALDNLHRAIDFADQLTVEKSEEFRHFFSGMVLVEQQMSDVLAEMGIETIPAQGSDFDPHLHEAVATEPTNDVAANTVTAELLRGYKVGDRVIRHSMVKVAVAAENAPTNSEALDEIFPAE